MRRAIGLIAAAIGVAGCAAAPQAPAVLRYGVTIDDITNMAQILPSLSHLPHRPSVRLVFDPGLAPAHYRDAVDRVAQVGDILAEPVDSSEVAGYTPARYERRFRQYVAAFGPRVAVWEVGNEVNGDWLGPAARVRRDILDAYRVIRGAGGRTALTFSYEPGCAASPTGDMWTWAGANVPAPLRDGLDYVLVSYYADDCGGYRPGDREWTDVFTRLGQMFPHARVGFGEVGTHRGDPVAVKLATLNRYYRMRIEVPGYFGGCFWWYYAEDMLPYRHNPLWQALSAALR